MTPFNVGRRIELNDFTEQEASSLAEGFGHSAAENRALLKRIFYWTNGHPYLTQRLCKVASENGVHHPTHDLDESIERTFFSKRAQENDDNLMFVRERLLRSGADVAELLNLYSRVRRNKMVVADDSQPLISILRLSGIARAENGRLRIRNRIYDRVFNDKWVAANLPGAEIRRQRAAFRRGVLRTAAVAAAILTVVAALAITAMRQRNRALEQTAITNQTLYMARMKLAAQGYENFNIAHVETWVNATTPQPGEADLRGFEWFLFWRYAHAEVMRLKEEGHIVDARFHQGNDTLAIATALHKVVDGNRHYLIKLYDRSLQKEISSFRTTASENFDIVAFSPDGKYVATDDPNNAVNLWDLSSQQQIHTFTGPPEVAVWSLAFARDGKALASAFLGGTFIVWDLNSGVPKFERHSKLEKPGIAFSPDGKHLAVLMDENVVEILDGKTGQQVRSFSFSNAPLNLVSFSPDGNRVFATTATGILYSLNLRDGQVFEFSETHSSEVSSFAFSPDGKTLATGSEDRTLKLWDVKTGKHLRTILGHGAWINSVRWSPSGRYLLSSDSDGLIKMWDMETVELPLWPDQKATVVFATGFTPQNNLMAIGLAPDKRVKLWNLSERKIVTDLGPIETISSAAFSKDATLVAAAVTAEVRIYSVTTGRLISRFADPVGDIYSLQFSPDGTKLLSGSRKRSVIVSEVSTGRTDANLDSGNTHYRAVFSSDGQKIASADKDGKIRIWDVRSRAIEKTLGGHEAAVKLLSFSSDDRLLASAGDDNTVRLWDMATGQEVKQPIRSDPVQRLIFTPDDKRLVTVRFDGAVVLWDPTTMQEVVALRKGGRIGQPTSVSFSRDGLILAVSDANGEVEVWQAGQPGL